MQPSQIEAACIPLGKRILGLLIVAMVAFVVVYGVPALVPLRVPIAYALDGAAIVESYLVVQFARKGDGPIPTIPMLAGCGFAVGGIALDVIATVIHSPDLARENNPVARALLAAGCSLTHIYLFSIVAQLSEAIMVCLMWGAFLRHRKTVIALTWSLGPRSYNEYTNAAVRGVLHPPPLISRHDFNLPRLNWYRFACMALCAYTASQLGRWYLGLEWFDLVPVHHAAASYCAAALGLVYFYAWLWLEYRKGPVPVAAKPPPATLMGT